MARNVILQPTHPRKQWEALSHLGRKTMSMSAQEPKPIISGLAPYYAYTTDLSYLLVRLTAGGMLLVHGIVKMTSGTVTGFAAGSLARRGIEPALPLAYVV